MKTVVHTKSSRDSLLHIETEGGIVNIRVGLKDTGGHDITSIEVLPDRGMGEAWKFADKPKAQAMNIRLTPVPPKKNKARRPRLTR